MAPQRQDVRRPPRETWTTYRQSIGDRSSLFAALAARWAPQQALYPGSYLDLSPSTALPAVTYVDTDARAERYFADRDTVQLDLRGRVLPGAGLEITFLAADFTQVLPLPDAGFDLLVCLYTGPAWEHCARYLAPDGLLLANTSHGDASLAALDPRLELVAAVQHRDGHYRLDTRDLGGHLVPVRPEAADAEAIRRRGRGIRYTRSAFAYVFRAT